MNRFKKEEEIKKLEEVKALTDKQITDLNVKNKDREEIETLAKNIHIKKFPEEYDYIYDNSVDIKERSKGINPMSQEYIKRIVKKRKNLGVSQLSESGMAVSPDTMNTCIEEAKSILASKNSL